MNRQRNDGAFCRAYLRTMDPERAAAEIRCRDGFAMLGTETIQTRLEKMREDTAGQIRREDAVRRLAQLAFGRANDAVKLALHTGEANVEELDLSAVAEFRVTDKGGVEVKLVDRVRALEALCALLENGGDHNNAAELYRALTEGSGEEGGWDNG
ncbi:hypothetical protein [Oscillibacter sp.]|uniref:hypothetical protein n=1 Tax=Oscillibacter sp. TaxID=1945593 RepID=UPI00262FF487|nr:hypothetical protein [Oscillibacter sp.]MDD3346828.1 hypothetical protein [Oscillibacter sp.]